MLRGQQFAVLYSVGTNPILPELTRRKRPFPRLDRVPALSKTCCWNGLRRVGKQHTNTHTHTYTHTHTHTHIYTHTHNVPNQNVCHTFMSQPMACADHITPHPSMQKRQGQKYTCTTIGHSEIIISVTSMPFMQ